jgi:hypothetical protein
MLYRGLKSLNKLNVIEEAKRVVITNTTLFINNLYFPKILLDLVKVSTFWASLNNISKMP